MKYLIQGDTFRAYTDNLADAMKVARAMSKMVQEEFSIRPVDEDEEIAIFKKGRLT